ncbi:MAG: FG-GAP-like repeat-containing protein [Acidobacteriota bacterium]|nr:FG-GAP-like repeat-containing protein [Acidobacteriota bacterium]
MIVNLRLFVSAFVLFAVSITTIFFAPHFLRVSAQAIKQISAAGREDAYRANNRGAAQLEQYNHQAGAAEFRRALEANPQLTAARVNLAVALFNLQDLEAARREAEAASTAEPERPQPHYILGLIAKNQNRTDDAIASLKKVLEIDANDVGANVNLGQIYVQQRKYAEAVGAFRLALAAEPYNATAMYTLATALLRTDAREEGQQLMSRFQALRQSGAATSIGQNYLEQGRYAEAIISTGAESELVDKTAPQVVFQNTNVGLSVAPAAKRRSKNAANKSDSEVPQHSATLFDFDNDGDLDLAQIAANSPTTRLYRNDGSKFSDVTRAAGDLNKGLETLGLGIVAGDFDNDTLSDLLVFGRGQPTLFRNNGQGNFKNVTAVAKISKSSIVSVSAAFVDADHDGDLDVFLGGFAETNKAADKFAANELLRNNGDGSFLSISEAAKINLPSRAVAVIPTDFDNRRDIDLLVLNHGSAPHLFRNLRDGSFRNVAEEVGLNQTAAWTCAAVGDFNKDTFVDFFFGKSSGIGTFAVSDGRGKFVLKDAPTGTENAASAQFLDYDNDGLLDLIVGTDKGFVVARNLGDGWTNADSSPFKIKTDAGNRLDNSRQILSGDVDGDGDVDLFAFARNGSLHFLRNDGGSRNNSEILRLQGRASNKTGIGAKIDMRSGSLTQKLESYSASPMPAPSDVHFGLGKREKPDAVRVIWTSGTVQAEVEFSEKAKSAAAKNFAPLKIEELDRKPSSCPYLYTWNGERFEFVTDFLGGGEMGNWKEAGAYHYPDSDEFVRITSDQLKPKNGKYEIRVTNELEEVLFLDHLKLVAVEHDAGAEVFPNEGLGIPTAGQEILYTTQNARPPLSAVDANGKSVLPKIENLDHRFYDDFKSLNIRGYAETHSLTVNLDDKKDYKGRTLLLLTGWTDYAFSSDNLAASQSGKSLFLPKLQVKNKKGEWQTVIDSIGISVGRPQTIVTDLTGKFLSNSREVRIVTNFKTFWDKIAVDTSEQGNVKTINLQSAQADLRERGFSVEIKYGEMIAANYDSVLNDGRWKYFSGNFTKLGAVNLLLETVDDVFVISKTGDELVLSFDALPELSRDKKYTFLLYADGYSKEMDINSGSPDQVFPMPFKAMKKYPYAPDEQFPMTEEKRRIYDEYTTRSVRDFLPRLETALVK